MFFSSVILITEDLLLALPTNSLEVVATGSLTGASTTATSSSVFFCGGFLFGFGFTSSTGLTSSTISVGLASSSYIACFTWFDSSLPLGWISLSSSTSFIWNKFTTLICWNIIEYM